MPLQSGSVWRLPEVTTPAVTPAAGTRLLYVKADGQLYTKNSAGTEAAVSAASSGPTAADLNDVATLAWMGL